VGVTGPASLELWLDLGELALDKIRVVARYLAEVVRRPHVVVRAVGGAVRDRVVMRAVVIFVYMRERACRFGDGTSGPPATDGSRDTADQRSDRTRRGTDSSADEYSGDTTRRFTQFVGKRWFAVVRPERSVFGSLEAAIDGIVRCKRFYVARLAVTRLAN